MKDKEFYKARRARRRHHAEKYINRRLHIIWQRGDLDWYGGTCPWYTWWDGLLVFDEETMEADRAWWRYKVYPHKYDKNNLAQCGCWACKHVRHKTKGFNKRYRRELFFHDLKGY